MRYLFTALLFLSACRGTGPDAVPAVIYDCTEQLGNVVQFTLACIERANPKADEEPEDWIELCEDMANRILCKKVRAFKSFGAGWIMPIPCTHAIYPKELVACRHANVQSEASP